MTLTAKTNQCLFVLVKPAIFTSLLVPLLYFTPLFAGEYHPHEDIRKAAAEFVRTQIPEDVSIKEIKVGHIDSRIKFKPCSQTLETHSSMNKSIAKRWTVNVSCKNDSPWSIYIPVTTRLTRKMLVSTTTITRGELISADKLKLLDKEISNQNKKHFSETKHVVGREARRTISPDKVINSNMLQEAFLVRKKETVLIYAKSAKIQISMKGTALKNGRYNEMIKVRNKSSKKVIEAIVIDRGVVAINF